MRVPQSLIASLADSSPALLPIKHFDGPMALTLNPGGSDGSAWEASPWSVAVVGFVLVAQLLVIVTLLVQHHRRRQADKALRAREADLRGSYERIRQLAGRLIHAQESARAGVARDLHDDICQQLAAVSLGVVMLKRSTGSVQDAATQKAFAELEYQTQVAFDGIRRLSHDLHPASLRHLGLAPALKTHCIDVSERYQVRVAFNASGDFRGLPDDVAICLYRIAQEAVRNAAVHSRARQISVAVARLDERVDLVVMDDGCGFDTDAMRSRGDGLGLVSIEERVRIVGGAVDLVSAPDLGTTIRVHCPIEVAAAEVADAV
jgi:two-component system sensor histidine kinase UhpB